MSDFTPCRCEAATLGQPAVIQVEIGVDIVICAGITAAFDRPE